MTARSIGKGVFASLFLFSGVMHLVSPGFFLKIMPPYLPYPWALVTVSGVFEIALGICLFIPSTSRLAAWGLIALLIAVFPANVYMFQRSEAFSIPPIALLIRLPLQGLLIWWAWLYTNRPRSVV